MGEQCRLVPADLSGGVEKSTFYQSFTSDSTWRLVIFTEDPVAWAGKSDHINVQGAAELTGQTGKGGGNAVHQRSRRCLGWQVQLSGTPIPL